MPMEFWTVAISVFGSALTAFGVAWLTGRNQRPVTKATAERERATAAREITDAATDMIDHMEKRLAAVEELSERQSETIATLQSQQIVNVAQIRFLTDRVATLTTGVRVLSGQIIEMGGHPKWMDPTEPTEGSEYVNPD